MDQIKEIFETAIAKLDEEENSNVNKAIREIIKRERLYFYTNRSSHRKLKEIREITAKYGLELGVDNVD